MADLAVSLLDNQMLTVSANPQTVTNRPSFNPANPFNFNVTMPIPSIVDVAITQGPNPFFTVKPKNRFFGNPQTVTLTMTALKFNGGPQITSLVTVTIHGSEPDDGTLDHFAPSATDPVPQS